VSDFKWRKRRRQVGAASHMSVEATYASRVLIISVIINCRMSRLISDIKATQTPWQQQQQQQQEPCSVFSKQHTQHAPITRPRYHITRTTRLQGAAHIPSRPTSENELSTVSPRDVLAFTMHGRHAACRHCRVVGLHDACIY